MTWFIHHDEEISGPFSTEHVQTSLKSGSISYGAYIWSKGQVEWIPVSDWENHLDSILGSAESDQSLWKFRSPDEVTENLSFEKVVKILQTKKSLKLLSVCPQQENKWVPVYSSYLFMEALNMSRRHFLRAPLMGLSKVTKEGSRFSYVVKTATIGQGGIGVSGLGTHFETGTKVTLKVESQDLGEPINVTGTVVYNTEAGFIGIRFDQLPAETNSIILNYMKCFHDGSQNSDENAA